MVPALTAAKFYFIYILLIYREDLASLRPPGIVSKTSPFFCQKRAGEEQVTANAALMAIASAEKKLALNISLSEMNQPKTPQLAGNVKQKTQISSRLCNIVKIKR